MGRIGSPMGSHQKAAHRDNRTIGRYRQFRTRLMSCHQNRRRRHGDGPRSLRKTRYNPYMPYRRRRSLKKSRVPVLFWSGFIVVLAAIVLLLAWYALELYV